MMICLIQIYQTKNLDRSVSFDKSELLILNDIDFTELIKDKDYCYFDNQKKQTDQKVNN